MDKSKITVIVPVYNTEKYVEESILSILGQSLKEIEVIIIDDGSTDNSLAIVKKLASLDSRIRIVSQKNSGQGVARNKGIELSQSDFLYFMDSDDILRSEALECCHKKCTGENLDFVFFDAKNFNETDKSFTDDRYSRVGKLTDKVYEGREAMNLLLNNNDFRVPVWLNVISKKFLINNNLKFHSTAHEDEIFTVELFCHAKRVGLINDFFLCRLVRADSVMTSKFSMRNAEAYLYIADVLGRYANSNKKIKKTVERYIRKMINAAVRRSHDLTFREKCHIATQYTFRHTKFFNIKTFLILFLK